MDEVEVEAPQIEREWPNGHGSKGWGLGRPLGPTEIACVGR